jgi:O-antigen/teichoic acid export membrane protein
MNNKNLTSFSHVFFGKTASTVSQATFYFLFAFLLEPEIFGMMSYFIAFAGVTSIISRFGLNHSIVVYQAKNNELFVNNLNSLSIIIISFISIIILFFDPLIALLSFSSSLFLMSIQNQLGKKEYKKYLLLNILRGTLMLSLPITLYFYFDISGVLAGMSLAYIISSFSFFKIWKIKYFSIKFFKKNFLVLLHNFGVDSSTNFVRFVDKLVIVPILGFTSLGIYQLNLQILVGLELFPLALHSFLLSEESSGNRHKKISIFVVLISVFIVLLVYFLAPSIIFTLLPEYSEGIPSLQILIISLIPLSLASIFNAKLQSRESTKVGYSALVRIGSLIFFIAILGSQYDLIGLSLAVLFSSVLYSGFVIFLFKFESKNRFL